MKKYMKNCYDGKDFEPIIGFTIERVDMVEVDISVDGVRTGEKQEVIDITLVNNNHVAIHMCVSEDGVSISEPYAVNDDLSCFTGNELKE